jgi:hypothetical protein
MITSSYTPRMLMIVLIAGCFWSIFLNVAFAQGLDVQFEQNPLFSEMNIVPGETLSRTVTVTNNGTSTEYVYISAEHVYFGGLEETMALVIGDGATTYFNDSFLAFFSPDPVALGTLAGNGAARTYTFTASLNESVGNDYQNKSMGFDIVVGFENGESVADTGRSGGGKKELRDGSENANSPEGQVAGESTSAPGLVTTLFDSAVSRPIIDLLRGAVLGAMATATAATSSAAGVDDGSGTQSQQFPGITAVTGALDDIDCTFTWLVLLVVISFTWSLVDDLIKHKGKIFWRFFVRNAVFSGVYLAGLITSAVFGVLEAVWWLFAGVWGIAAVADYVFHRFLDSQWSAQGRNIFFAACGFVALLFGYFTDILCVWVPFLLISLISAVLIFLDR